MIAETGRPNRCAVIEPFEHQRKRSTPLIVSFLLDVIAGTGVDRIANRSLALLAFAARANIAEGIAIAGKPA